MKRPAEMKGFMVNLDPEDEGGSRSEFADLLLDWFEESGRQYPWRENRKPYEILIAEIMLQRTKADQVAPVYREFMKRFPNIETLRRASKPQIAKFFAKLGLTHRAELVGMLARDLNKRFCGAIPESRLELMNLPSVGEYVADAVLCFAFGRDVSVVDSNVCRVIGRVYNLDVKGEARRNPKFRQIVNKLLPVGDAMKFNWAIIDLASKVCLPRKPQCRSCPLKALCMSATITAASEET